VLSTSAFGFVYNTNLGLKILYIMLNLHLIIAAAASVTQVYIKNLNLSEAARHVGSN
jgi:hypothetical protein